MATPEALQELKAKYGMGRFANYPYEKLCELINPDVFYKEIRDANSLRSFLQALSFEFCVKNGYTPAPLSFSEDNISDIAYTVNLLNGKSKVVFNKLLQDMLIPMGQHQNKFYPYMLVLSAIHESIHVGQNEATYNPEVFNALPNDLKIAVLDRELNHLKVLALAEGKIGASEGGDDYVSSVLMLEKVLEACKLRENPLYNYANSPDEITARDHSIKEVEHIVSALPNAGIKSLLTEFVKDSKHHSLQMFMDRSLSNYQFFEELEKGELYHDVPEISEKQQQLVELVDAQLLSQHKGTFSDYLTINDTEFAEVAEEIERLSELNGIVGMIVSTEAFSRHCDKLSEELDEKRLRRLKTLNADYTALFPETHALTMSCPKGNPFIYREQLIFDTVKAQISQQKTKR